MILSTKLAPRVRGLSTQASLASARALNARLDRQSDPELYEILEREKQRQRNSLVLIASENYAPRRVFDALATVMVSPPIVSQRIVLKQTTQALDTPMSRKGLFRASNCQLPVESSKEDRS